MRVLALDTATELCSVALLTARGTIVESVEIGRGHAQEILGMIDRVLAAGETPVSALSGIVAGIGPGSFTGVRVCITVAQGLALGAGLPVVPVNSLEALALQAGAEGAKRVLACLDARMGEVYWGCFTLAPAPLPSSTVSPPSPSPAASPAALPAISALGPLRVGAASEVQVPAGSLEGWTGIGRGFAAYPELARIEQVRIEPAAALALPDVSRMARLGAARLAAGECLDAAQLVPLYVRDSVALTEAERARGRPAPHG